MIRRVLFLFAFICMISSVYSVTTIGSLPYNITSPGEYNISGNLSSTGHGIIISTQNVSLNCEGFTITGDLGVNDYGIHISSETTDYNNISNCNLKNYGYGIYNSAGDNNNFQNISIINVSGSYNIYLAGSSAYNLYNNITINTSSLKYSYYTSTATFNILNNSNLGDGYVMLGASDNSKVQNSFFTNIDSYITISRSSDVGDCLIDLINVTKPDGKYIYNFYSTVNIDGWTNISQLILCNADNSTIQNLNLIGNRQTTAITMIELNNVTFLNLNISNYTRGIEISFGSNNNITNINSYSNSQDGIYFVNTGNNNNLNTINVYNNDQRGIYLSGVTGNNFTNINSSSNTLYGFVSTSGSNTNIINSTIYDNGNIDIYIYGTTNTHCNNLISNVTDDYGKYHYYFNQSVNINGWTNISSISLCNADNSVITNLNYDGLNNKGTFLFTTRTEYSNFSNLNVSNYYYGIYLDSSSNNSVSNFNTYNNTQYGIYLSSSNYNNLNNFNTSFSAYGTRLASSSNNSLSNFMSYNNTQRGLYLGTGGNNNITNFSTYNNLVHGVSLGSSTYNNFSNFTTYKNTQNGLEIQSNDNYFENFNSYNNSANGIASTSSQRNRFNNFNTYYNTNYGIYFSTSSNNNISNFVNYNNTNSGIYLTGSSSNKLENFSSYNNIYQGILMQSSDNNTLNNFTNYNNSQNGIYLSTSSNNNISNSLIYNNNNYGLRFLANSDNNIISNSSNINNTLYNIFFEESGGNKAENNTFYNNYLGNVSKVSSNNWSNINYFNSSLSGYNIGNYWNDFGVCSVKTLVGPYGVCANPANYTINSTNNIYDFAPLYNPYEIDSCTNLTIAGGNYYMTASILNSATSNCINISANNITFDCRGFTIDGNDAVTQGIVVSRSLVETTNVTIKNCIVSDWNGGANIYLSKANGNSIYNITSNSSTTNYGIFLSFSSNNSLTNFNSNNNGYGILMLSSINNTINNFSSYNNGYGFWIMSNSKYNVFNNITAVNNTNYGIYVSVSQYNNFTNSISNNNSKHDILIATASTTDCNNLFSNVTDNLGKYHIYSNQSINIDGWTNISSIILCNADNSIIKNLNYTSIYNTKGTFIYSALTDNSNFTNLTINNYYYGAFINININNILNSLIIKNNAQDGVYLNGGNNNNLSYLTLSNNYQGISLTESSNNIINNFNISSNSANGILFTGSKNNTFSNGTFSNNSNYNLYFSQAGANYPVNNTFYNNHLENKSTLYSNNWTNINYFNYSLPGVGSIGNYWNDFPACSSSETRGSYKVCLNPANYTLNSTNNIYDFAPLIIAPEYISPTPANNSNLGANTFTISVQDTQGVSTWFNVTINGVSYAMTNTSSTNYEYTLTDGFNEITEVTFNVSYAGSGIMETRTFTYYPDYTSSILSSYGFTSFFISIISIVFLFFNLNFRKNKNNKKGITEVIAIISLLLVAVTAAIFVNSWYQDFSTSYQTKKLASSATSANSFEVVAIKNESSSLFVYLKSKSAGYSIIERISVNSIDCTLVQDNVILGSSITPIEVECSGVDSVNNYIVVYSKKAVFSGNLPLIN